MTFLDIPITSCLLGINGEAASCNIISVDIKIPFLLLDTSTEHIACVGIMSGIKMQSFLRLLYLEIMPA